MSSKYLSSRTITAIGAAINAQQAATLTTAALQSSVRNDLIALGVSSDALDKGFTMPAKPQGKLGEYVLAFATTLAACYTTRYGVELMAYNTNRGGIAIKPAEAAPKKSEDPVGFDVYQRQRKMASNMLVRVFTFEKPEAAQSPKQLADAWVKRFDALPASVRRIIKAQIAAE